RGGRCHGGSRRERAGPRGDEDAAHDQGTRRRRRHRGRRRLRRASSSRRRTGRGRHGRRRRRPPMSTTAFTETQERRDLRTQVAKLAGTYGREYFTRKARAGEKTTELWLDIGKHGYLG